MLEVFCSLENIDKKIEDASSFQALLCFEFMIESL